MVDSAPTFQYVASRLAEHLDRSVLVAHNISFDQRMISQEYDRMGAVFNPGIGVCTLLLTKEKLILAAKRFGIKYENHHSALADARATAEIFKLSFEEYEGEMAPMSITKLDAPPCEDVVVRNSVLEDVVTKKSLIEQICIHTRFPTTEGDILQYLDMLNSILADLTISAGEQNKVNDLIKTLELDSNDIHWAHDVYLQTLIAGAKRDGIITEREKEIIDIVADTLGVAHQEIPSDDIVCTRWSEGTRVCFTGTAVDSDNQKIERGFLEAETAKRGLQPVRQVTKKGCDLLVTQDIKSQSTKAQKARSYKIEIVSANDFLSSLGL